MKLMRNVVVVSLVALGLAAVTARAQTRAVTDSLNLETVPAQTLMQQVGWPVLAGRNGGWGRFPDTYSYRRVTIDGQACLVDSYPFAQTHGSSNAIMLDWDGDPSNGLTALDPRPGMTLRFQVSVYMQPWTQQGRTGWGRAGARMVRWRFGPGVVPRSFKPVENTRKHPGYDWQHDRGPRVGYHLGTVPGLKATAEPVVETLAPGRDKIEASYKPGPARRWYDLRLTVTLGKNLRQARCVASVKPSAQSHWRTVGKPWQFAIDPHADTASNPARWNALILDLRDGLWSRKGYGKPTVSMLDRYRGFIVTVKPAAAHGGARHGRLMHFKRREVACTMPVPARVFRGQTVHVPVRLLNAGDKPLRGELVRRVGERQQTIARDWTLPVNGRWHADWTLRPTYAGKPITVALDLRRADGKMLELGHATINVLGRYLPSDTQNVVRNASFELPAVFNGGPMYRGSERFYTFAKSHGKHMRSVLPIGGWWAVGPSTQGITIDTQHHHSGKQSLRITASGKPITVVSAPGNWLPRGNVTVSAWVRTQGAKGRIQANLMTSANPIVHGTVNVRRDVALPLNSGWTRLSFTTHIDRIMEVLLRIQVRRGRVWVDDVQVQPGSKAGAFNVRPAEWVRLGLPAFAPDILPKWVAGRGGTHTLSVQSDSREPLGGRITVRMGLWNKPGTRVIGRVDASRLAHGQVVRLPFSTRSLGPEAYVVTADYRNSDGQVRAGAAQFDPLTPVGGVGSDGMLLSRQALRFAIVPDYKPARIFGVGNSMLDTSGSWFGGFSIQDYQLAGKLGFVCTRMHDNQDHDYLLAAAGMPMQRMESVSVDGDRTHNPAIDNPAKPGRLDLTNPQAHAFFLKQALRIGRQNARNPQIASYQMANEQYFPSRDGLDPSPAADAAFRDWCKKELGNLAALNRRWGTHYRDWSQVTQPLSARYVATVRKQGELKGAAAVAWTHVYGHMSKQVNKLIQSIPGRGMDWYRWRTAQALRMYEQFRHEARTVDKKTLYSTNLPWPDFWPQMAMPFFRAMDATMLDMEYSAGLPRGLGTPSEMMEILEMFESNAPRKPMWGIEIYTQPQWPAGSTALQNWAMVAHGMDNVMVFGWKPYSDYGAVKGTGAWKKPGAHPMWFIIDNDGTRLPSYYAVTKTTRQIQRFNQHFDGLALRRDPTKVAIYVADDTSEYLSYLTANKPYQVSLTHSRNTLIYLMRMAGIQADYLDDTLLGKKLDRYHTLILPPTPVLREDVARRIAAFVRSGGELVLDGSSGRYDPWLNRRDSLGGVAWRSLGWKAPRYERAQSAKGADFRGIHLGHVSSGQPITDRHGRLLGWQKPWGKGHVVIMGVYPSIYSGSPHIPGAAAAWMQRVIAAANLPIAAKWTTQQALAPPAPKKHGAGAPVVEVVLRPESDRQVFAFVLNQGGPGRGVVTCSLPKGPGRWQAHDALTGKAVAASVVPGGLVMPITLKAWGYRVLRLSR